MPSIETAALEERITALAERAAAGSEIEIVSVELRGGGKARLLRVYIDKPGGVTHGDCEHVSQRLSETLDAEDVVPGDSYTLEVSSPGIERPLKTKRDFERVIGQKAKVISKTGTRIEGAIEAVEGDAVKIKTASEEVTVPLDQIRKANLKFEW